MVNTRKRQKKSEKEPETDSQSENNEIFEKLKIVVAAETEKIEISNKRKFDEIAEKLQSMEKSIAKIPKLSNNRNKTELKKKFVLKDVFEPANDLTDEGDSITSEDEEHYNVKWYMEIGRNESHLEFFLYCEPIAPVSDKWSIETKSKFKIIGNDCRNITKTAEQCFEKVEGRGYSQFLEWKEIKNYLIDDNLTVEMEVEILKMTGFEKENLMKFDESVADFSDIVLIVNDRKFYLSKYFLALQSSYFNTLFSGKFQESEKSEIELKDIDPDDFQNFLELIHGEASIDDDSVSGILQLADMYDAPTAVRKCEEFLLEKSKKNLKKKLQLATRYNLEKLKEKCMNEIKTIEDLRSVIPNNFDEFDHKTTFDLLAKSISFH
ncbi:hypothetical protein B9Z55_007739 [Caenorhabditis nigoni]|uniref:BTB domain-containing protein n=2 Tax=Caenorhabditis nigoni TaxID=1611254 RepID=A0A2G5VB57_9PELO|nr:hypothetical protein B9Z55_007739 [Caenorhabditis nigoni]